MATQNQQGVVLPRVGIVGPLPPPSGGMANQCEQLVRLLRAEGLPIEHVRTNSPYQPAWVGRLPVIRAGFRLLPYLWQLWGALGRVEVLHILANSGWAWHLFTAPAVWLARLRGCAVVINYRGGNAAPFFESAPRYVLRMLGKVALRVTPSNFLLRVFANYGLGAEVIPNIIDLSRFSAGPLRHFGNAPHIVVTRNLEPIYDIPTAILAFAQLRTHFPAARMTVAGSGPDLPKLQVLVAEQGLGKAVHFSGRIENADIPRLYAEADCMLNPSTVDNMPISILESFASGVPVVSTCAGGIPDMLSDGVSGLLVPIGDPAAMCAAVLRVLQDRQLAGRLRQAGRDEAERYAWPQVREQWLDAYRRAAATRSMS
ncbi:glycosyl transferase family 1 [Chitinimonas sp. BJB300]|nr:glycosyl transferase family 1 [Chitinimonas sp. BJB300]TSJ89165.1 glycosyltransferase family 4 protein [Chitinimonas sp. BJB300]